MKRYGRSLVVLYGSKNGNDEEFDGRIEKEGIRYSIKGMVEDNEECEMEELKKMKDIKNYLEIFWLDKYGEGDKNDNEMELYEWIKNGEKDFGGINYDVFGIGKKNYEN